MLRKFMFLDTESLEDYYLSISDNKDINNIKKFNELYKYLEENNIIKGLEINEDKIKVGDIIEINIEIRIPKLYMQIRQVEKMAPFFGCAQDMGILQMSSMEDIKILKQLKGLSGLFNGQDIPIIGENVDKNNNLKIITNICERFLKVDLKEIEGEVKIIGKVKSVINSDNGIDVYNIMPEIEKIIPNRENRRDFKKQNKEFVEYVP